MPKTEIIGTGITQRPLTTFDTSGDTPGDVEAFWRHHHETVRGWIEQCDQAGSFGAVTADARKQCGEILEAAGPEYPLTDYPKGCDKPEALAYLVNWDLDAADNSITSGDADASARYGFEAGIKWATALIKWQWEKAAIRGDNTVKSASTGGTERARNYRDRNAQIKAQYKEILEKRGNASAAKESVQKKFEITRHALNRILRTE